MGRLEQDPVPPQPIQTPPPSQEPIQSYASEPVAMPSQQPPAAAYPQPVAYPPPPEACYSQPAAYQQPHAATYAQPAVYPPPAAYQQPPAATYAQPAAYSHPPATTYVQPEDNPKPPTTAYAQPVATGTPLNTQGEWSTGLFDCFDDSENAIETFFCPCVTFGQIAEILDEGETSCGTCGVVYSLVLMATAFFGFPCGPCLVSCGYRTELRKRYNLHETPAPDCMVHFFCECCALCQEYRELKNRDLDPALGWQGNLSKSKQMANAATMAPPVNQRMRG